MNFKYLNLKKIRPWIINPDKRKPEIPGRRKFVKAMGLGAIAWNPVIESLSHLSKEEFIIKSDNNRFRVIRNNKTVWEISDKIFENGFDFYFDKRDESYFLEAKKLQIKFTSFTFSFNAKIYYEHGNWYYHFQIPEFRHEAKGNFLKWLDGYEDCSSDTRLNIIPIALNHTDLLKIQGKGLLQINNNWQFLFSGHQLVSLKKDGHTFYTNQLILEPVNHTIISQTGNTQILLPEFQEWDQFISNSQLQNTKLSVDSNIAPDLNINIFRSKSGELVKTIECNQIKGFKLYNNKLANKTIEFDNTYYYAEYLNEYPSNTYLSATLPAEGTWIVNKLGSFKIEKNKEIPDFEAFGNGNVFHETVIEPRLNAFKPVIPGAITLNTSSNYSQNIRISDYQNPVRTIVNPPATRNIQSTQEEEQQENTSPQEPVRQINIQRTPVQQEQENEEETPQDPIRNIRIQPQQQEPVRNIQQNQPEISIRFDELRFRPRQAIKINILRPEDLVLLEYEFHNFNFTNKGQAPYLEIDNTDEAGVIVIFFQSQHTLEEAYYESTAIPDPEGGSTGQVNLPAKHIRARKTRLVYEYPAESTGFPLTMIELLDWSKFNLRVHPRAWIKIPVLGKIQIPTRITLDKKTTIPPNKNTRYLDTETKEYGIRLAQNTKTKANNLAVYNENEIAKVLTPQSTVSLRPTFNVISALQRIDLSVGPIPDLSTSIEAPTLMYISPNQVNDFYHKLEASFRDVEELRFTSQLLTIETRVFDPLSTTKGEITELWHSRLGVKLNNGKTSGLALPEFKTIRALWADDADRNYQADIPRNYPFMASLDANNRHKLVHTTSNYEAGFTPIPVPVNDLMLTTLGAYLDWHAFFDVPTPQDTYLNIIEWEHIATLGRDHFVKIVEEGYLFPFGHRAAVVKITERKFHDQTKAAVNRQRMFVVVLEKEVLYSRNDPEGNFIEFPFQAVRIKTNATPNIDNPEEEGTRLITVPPSSGGISRITNIRRTTAQANTAYNFYINVGGNGFPFDIVATDKEGLDHPFRMPLAFMENRVARDKDLMEQVIEVYRGNESNNYNKIYNETGFSGQEIAYAEYLVDGDTAFETETIKFDAQIYPVDGAGEIKFHPRMKEANVFIKQIDEMTGSRQATTIGLEDDDNPGDVFARVISDTVVDFSGGSDKSGGFMLPNMAVSGLSKLQGPVSGNLEDLKDLLFVPEEFFEAFEDLPVAKIFGVIEIFSLLFGDSGSPFDLGGTFNSLKNTIKSIRDEIEDIKNDILYYENLAEEAQEMVEDQIEELKQMITEKVNELLSALNDSIPRIPNLKAYVTEEAFYAEYKWQPELGGTNIEVIPSLLNVKVNDPSTALSITTKFEKPFSADKSASLNGLARFEKFGVDIVPLLAVNFNYLEFKTGSSEKTDVKVDIDQNNPIEFKGVLNFVNNLQSIIPSTGFSDDGPYIDIKPTGVTAGFDISIPNVEVGICMISNISLGANITLPFTGAPLTMGFNFCKRENPFMLTISCFGGGGYFMMVTTLKGLHSLEAAFEFGAAMSLNVGVASGGVSAMGGFYYKMEIIEGTETSTLTGYLRINGHLSILGLISLSLEFYLAFSAVIYDGKVQKLEGEATLKVKVEVLFFSKTVSVTVRRELKGADADPKFIEMIDQDDWQEYCLAFAS